MHYKDPAKNNYKAVTPEELGAEMLNQDLNTESVLSDRGDELKHELGDYLEEVLVDLDDDTRERVFAGYRAERDRK